jgi:endo-1,4-beta-D-glucanase Y
VQGQPVLAADDLERYNKTSIVVNPSYFAPYSYKLFAIVDKTHDWTALVNNSYTLLGKLSTDPLGSTTSDGLPPDWITINRQTGAFTPDAASNLDTNYSYDAIRVPFRLALDYEWFKDPRDEQLLQGYSFLKQQFQKNGKLDATYAHDGTVPSGDSYESPAVYGASLGYFKVVDPADEKAYYQKKLVTLYSPDLQEWKTPLSYYDDNWAWFGIALAQDALPNLAETNQ